MKRTLLCASLLFLALPAPAHDLWLVPPQGPVPVSSPVEIVLSVGMDFPVSLSALKLERVTVLARGPGGATAPVELRREEDRGRTVATFTPTVPGGWVVSATTLPNTLSLDAAKFNDYLLHDGMPHVLAGRMDRGELDRPSTERYSKHVKALVTVAGNPKGDVFREVVGQEFEIVLLANPLATPIGGTLPVEVRFRGSPLPHANLCWDHPGNGEDFTGQTWTDADGKALVPLGKAGPMTLRLVHMTRPQAADHEWESFWASATFCMETPN